MNARLGGAIVLELACLLTLGQTDLDSFSARVFANVKNVQNVQVFLFV